MIRDFSVTPESVVEKIRYLLYNEISDIISYYVENMLAKLRKIQFSSESLAFILQTKSEKQCEEIFDSLKRALNIVLLLLPVEVKDLYFFSKPDYYLEEFTVVDIFDRPIVEIKMRKQRRFLENPLYEIAFKATFYN